MKSKVPLATQTHMSVIETDCFNVKPQVPLATQARVEPVTVELATVKSQAPLAAQTHTPTLQTASQTNMKPQVPSVTQAHTSLSSAHPVHVDVKSQAPPAAQTHTDKHHTEGQGVSVDSTGRDDSTNRECEDRPKCKPTLVQRQRDPANTDTETEGMEESCNTIGERATSYFLSGKIMGKFVRFLIDTGCSTNIIAKRTFDRLPKSLREKMEPYNALTSQADGSPLVVYGQLAVEIKLRDVRLDLQFLICPISDDAILGLDFLQDHQCTIMFKSAALQIGDKILTCEDRDGRRLSSKVHALRQITIGPTSHLEVECQLSSDPEDEMGLVESWTTPQGLMVASSINRPTARRLRLQCLNPTEAPLTVKVGDVLGFYQAVEEVQPWHQSDGESSSHVVRRVNESPIDDTDTIPSHVRHIYDGALDAVSPGEDSRAVARLLTEYADVFSSGADDIGLTTLVQHSIPMQPGSKPRRQPARRLGPEKDAEVERQVQKLQAQGLIEPGDGEWSSPVVLVRKADGKSWRLCIDYRQINEQSCHDAYPLPRIDESLDSLSGSKYFSTLDLLSGYWQVPLDKDAQEKSAFITRGGLWKWRVLPMGLRTAPATFERLMESVLKGMQWQQVLCFLDDIIIFAADFHTHLHRLEEVLKRLRHAGLKLTPKKCELFKTEVRYLGHVVSQHGVATDPDKIKAVSEWKAPESITELRAYLGIVNYYRKYCPDLATMLKPLNKLTAKGQTFDWGEEQQRSFEQSKEALVTAPILGYPDPELQYILDTDASLDGAGSVLSQCQSDGVERVIAYYSKTFSSAERNYCVTRRELLAVIMAVKHFRPYIYGRTFRIRTDHASLIWLHRRREPSSQVARWLEILEEFSYIIQHRSGVAHGNADGLSRSGHTSCNCKQCVHIETRDGGPTMGAILLACEDDPTEEFMALEGSSKLISSHRVNTVSVRDLGPAVTASEIIKLQMDLSTDVGLIYQLIKRGELTLTSEELELGGRELRRLHDMRQLMSIRADGVLMVNVSAGKNRRTQVAVCPPTIRPSVIWRAHELAHSGMAKTLARLKLSWYWPGMTAEVRIAVRTCEICQMAKQSRIPLTSNQQRIYAGRCFQKLCVDLVGPLPETTRGNNWVLVIMDTFSRYWDALPIPDGTTHTIARTLDERLFCYFGICEQLHSDQGAAFESALMDELCQLWGIKKTRTTSYNPRGNSVVERANRGLGDSLRALLLDSGEEEWDLLLPHLTRTFRASPHAITKESPNYMIFGRDLRLPDMLLHEVPDDTLQTPSEYVRDLQKRLTLAHDMLRQQQLHIRSEDCEEPPLFVEGDMVLMVNKRRRKGPGSKLAPKFVGPYEVVNVNSERHTYEIERDGQRSVQSERRLKLHRPCTRKEGQAPVILEPTRQPNMKGVRNSRGKNLVTTEELLTTPTMTENSLEHQNGVSSAAHGPPQTQLGITDASNTDAIDQSREADRDEATSSEEGQSLRPTRNRRPPPRLQEYVARLTTQPSDVMSAKLRSSLLGDGRSLCGVFSIRDPPTAVHCHPNTQPSNMENDEVEICIPGNEEYLLLGWDAENSDQESIDDAALDTPPRQRSRSPTPRFEVNPQAQLPEANRPDPRGDGRVQAQEPEARVLIPQGRGNPHAQEPVARVPPQPTRITAIIDTITRARLEAATGPPHNRTCQVAGCGITLRNRRKLRLHVNQHFTRIVCTCGDFISRHKSSGIRHMTRHHSNNDGQTLCQIPSTCGPEINEAVRQFGLARQRIGLPPPPEVAVRPAPRPIAPAPAVRASAPARDNLPAPARRHARCDRSARTDTDRRVGHRPDPVRRTRHRDYRRHDSPPARRRDSAPTHRQEPRVKSVIVVPPRR